jgi:site-specific DNA recombinase
MQLSLFDPAPAVMPVVVPVKPSPVWPQDDPADGSPGLLSAWARDRLPAVRCGRPADRRAGVRFAFYGRVSTAGFQDRSSSRQWQRDSAMDLISGRGRIVVEYFDVGCTRRQPWSRRPQARELLRAAARPDRGFDAVVVGEADRAFCGTQLLSLAPALAAYGVAVWLPEIAGPVDLDDSAHRAVVLQVGAQARREVQRARFRTTVAMTAQTREQGRYLGGRPPYGYRLVDAGPHPNQVHARWGRRLHRLDPDPDTAPIVQWIFRERAAGRAVAGIARALNEAGVACPSRSDADRNRHRSGRAWMTPTVASILANPRYTGRQVWNRQPTIPPDPRLPAVVETPQDVEEGRVRPQRWNPAPEWVISTRPAHPALVSEADFVAVQGVWAPRGPGHGQARAYRLAGVLDCGICGRRMDCHWGNGRAGYRCRHGRTSAHVPDQARPRMLYVREDELLSDLDALLPGNDGDPGQVVARLRTEKITIVCDRQDRRLSRDLT